MTERIRILIHISNYFPTLEIMEKRSPIRMNLIGQLFLCIHIFVAAVLICVALTAAVTVLEEFQTNLLQFYSLGEGGGGRECLCHGCPQSYDHGPSHPCNAGTEHIGFSPTRQTLLAPSAKQNVRRSVSRMKGELPPTKNRLRKRVSAPCRRSFLCIRMTVWGNL